MIKNKILQILKRNELDSLLDKARKAYKKRFLIVWNRGLGDIALGLYALVYRIREFIPEAQITFITRKELEEAFYLIEGVDVIGVPWWQRGTQIDIGGTLQRLGIDRSRYDVLLEKVNPTKWLSWQIGKLTPKLKWKSEYDELWKHFSLLDPSRSYICVHLNTETSQFYGYQKDWPASNWGVLFERLSKIKNMQIVLFGHNRIGTFELPSIIDLRGQTTLLEMLSVIKNCCNILIAPDGGVLSIMYYLDISFIITVISLWSDPNQGILKQAVPSPNPGLTHTPVIGKGKDISRISIDEVYSHVVKSL